MDDKVILKKDSKSLKKPFHLKRNVFILYAPRNITIEPTEFKRIDLGILAFIPKNGRGFVTSKFRGDENIAKERINQIITQGRKRGRTCSSQDS